MTGSSYILAVTVISFILLAAAYALVVKLAELIGEELTVVLVVSGLIWLVMRYTH